MKRYWYLIVLSILFLGVLVYYGTNRVTSINIMDSGKITVNHPVHKMKVLTSQNLENEE